MISVRYGVQFAKDSSVVVDTLERMAEFENQPPSRSRTNSAVIDDTLSDVSTSYKDMSDALRRGHGKEAYETYKRLQSDYDALLTKYAQAENTIDQLRIGAKLNLYSDLPPPQKSSFVTVSGGKQPHVFNFQKPSQASYSRPSTSNVVTDQSNGTNNLSFSPESDKMESDLLTPEVRAEGIRTALMFKIPTLQENVEDLQSHVTEGQWGENELRELSDVCGQLTQQHELMKHELIQAKKLERNSASVDGNLSSDAGDFLHEDDIEGQLYRLGLRLDEINEQIEQNLHQFPSNSGGDATITNRMSSLPKEPAKRQHMDPELSDLMRRLRDVKESAKNDDALSRSANSLADVEDLEYNAANSVQRRQDDFTLGHVNDDSDDDHDKKRDSHNGGVDLQESGYFASETMSVSHDHSDPISNHYLSNSLNRIPLRERGHDTSFDQQSVLSSPGRERPLSDTSIESSPNPRRSRRTSQRSRSSTLENPPANPMTFYPQYPASPPIEQSPPQASSSVLTDQTRHQPHADRRESRSRAPTTDSKHSKDLNHETRKTKPYGSQADILRTEHDNPRDRSHDYSRDRTRSLGDDISPRSRSNPAESLETSPRNDMKTANERKPGRQRVSLSSADSRVSTPLFHPGARPKDVRRRDKTRPPTADTERGFDSGFFGSEGSRGSRFARTPEVPPESKIIHPCVREQTISESEGERYRSPQVTHLPVKSFKRDTSRRRRSYLQSLSESDEDRGLEPSPSVVRPSSNQRDRRHRHTPTFPATRSDNERSRRLDGDLRRPSSSPNIYELPERSQRSDPLRGSRSQLRPDSMRKSLADLDKSTRTGPRSDHDTRPMDKQSMRSYPGMDRESVRSGRRSRRDDDSSSGYSDGRKHRRDRVDKLQEELQRLRTQLQDESSARNLQAEMYGDLRRKHDDLEREIARRSAEHQMKSMYEDLQKKYEDLSKNHGNQQPPRDTATQVDLSDDLKKRLEELSLQVNDLKNRSVTEPGPGHVRFLCPFCGGCNGHHHGSYYYPGYSGTGPTNGIPGTPRHSMGTQTQFVDEGVPQQTRYPATPQATSTPYYTGYHSAPVNHYHTSTYPGGVPTGSPIHHVHHLPDGRTRDRYDDEYSSDEDDRYRLRRRGTSYRGTRRRTRELYPEDETLDSHRLHLSLDEANRAARRMQRLSKKMLNSVASDLIRSGHR